MWKREETRSSSSSSSSSSLSFSFSLSHALLPRTSSSPPPPSYLALSRPWNLFPSILMVFAGAAAAAARTKGFSTLSSSPSSSPPSLLLPLLSLLANPTVWQAALSTAAIALGSMVVNDYFDVPNDRVNAPTKPLPSGQITVDGALLFGGFLYLSTLVAAAWLEPRELRLLVASSAAVTLAYTPVLKKIPLVKTVAVAGVVALSPAAGALAVSSSGSFPLASSSLSPALAAVAPACLALFFAISGRELLMDAADARGDGAAGVPTLPVVAGRRATLALAAACELAAAGVLVSRAVALVASSSSASASASASVARQGASSLSFLIPVTVALGTALVLPAARAASAALKLGRLRKEEKRNQKKESLPSSPSPSLIEAEVAVSSAIDKAVNTMMKPVGVAVIGALVLG